MPAPDSFKTHDSGSYDAFAATYGLHVGRLAGPLADAALRLAEVSPGDAVLDVACGTGVATRALTGGVGPSGSVLGIDLSEGMLAEARRAGRDQTTASFARMDAERLELPDAAFDAVVSLCAVLHFPDVGRALREMRRVLRPGGSLVVSYGAGRPSLGLGLARHALRHAGRRRALTAPSAIMEAIRALPPGEEDVLTAWSRRGPRRALEAAVRDAGFTGSRTCWVGRDHDYAEPDAFWEAQAAIVTEARRRLSNAAPETVAALRADAVARWQAHVAAGGSLVYPYGAVLVRATAPL